MQASYTYIILENLNGDLVFQILCAHLRLHLRKLRICTKRC